MVNPRVASKGQVREEIIRKINENEVSLLYYCGKLLNALFLETAIKFFHVFYFIYY